MRVTSMGHFIDNILEYLNIAASGEEVVINHGNKKLHITLEEKRRYNDNNYDDDPRCNIEPR